MHPYPFGIIVPLPRCAGVKLSICFLLRQHASTYLISSLEFLDDQLPISQVGYREPYIWADVLQGASQILEKGGILLMYDTETWTKLSRKEGFGMHVQASVCQDLIFLHCRGRC